MNKGTRFSVAVMTRIAILAAASAILNLISIPVIAFYKLDLSTLPALLGGLSMGPIPGVCILAISNVIGLLHSSSAGIGKLADFIMGAAMVLPAALIYHRNKTRKTAIIGMAVGSLCAMVVGVLVNKWILFPFYMSAYHMDFMGIISMAKQAWVDSEWKLLLLITGPFNLLKGVVLGLITALIYKPLSPILHEKIR